MLGKYVSWNDHKITIENKIAKNIVLQKLCEPVSQ